MLDGFRGLAIVLVVITHSFVTGYDPRVAIGPFVTDFGFNAVVNAGSLGVELFFFISGLVLFLPYARAKFGLGNLPTLGHFLDRRFIKIVPSYYLALFITAVFFWMPDDVAARRTTEVIRHALFIHTHWSESMFAIVGAFWSLGVEAQFYVVFPFLAMCMRRAPIRTYAVLLVIGESYRMWLHATGHHRGFYEISQLPAHIDLFALGMFCAYLFVRFRGLHGRAVVERAATAVAVLAFAAGSWLVSNFAYVTTSMKVEDHQSWQSDHRIVVGYTIALLIMGSLFSGRAWRAIVANPLLVWLSGISYNLYLWHGAVITQCRISGFPCSGLPTPWLTDNHWGTHFFFGYVFVSLAIATVVTYAFERPLLRLGSRGVFSALAAPVRRLLDQRIALRTVHEPPGDLELTEQP